MKATENKTINIKSTDKIAIISDIHGNMPALESVLEDIEKRNIKTIYCLGDMAGKGPHSAETVDIVREKCQVIVMGNWEYFLSEHEGNEMVKWHKKQLGEERLNYMRELPLYIEFYMSGKLFRLCHASPTDVFHRVFRTASKEEKLSLFHSTFSNKNESDVLGYGDIHGAYIEHFNEKTLFNVGSVGNPLDVTQASYGIIEGIFDSREIDTCAISIVRVPYDVERSIKYALDSDMPEKEEYINELRTGIYRGLKNKKGVKE